MNDLIDLSWASIKYILDCHICGGLSLISYVNVWVVQCQSMRFFIMKGKKYGFRND